MMWDSEDIPSSDTLYYRAHRTFYGKRWPLDSIPPTCFMNRPKDDPDAGMSTDWSKYASPEESRSRARQPIDNAVVALTVADVHAVPGQRVAHTPQPDNRAHTDVFGDKSDPEVQTLLSRIARLVIPLE